MHTSVVKLAHFFFTPHSISLEPSTRLAQTLRYCNNVIIPEVLPTLTSYSDASYSIAIPRFSRNMSSASVYFE